MATAKKAPAKKAEKKPAKPAKKKQSFSCEQKIRGSETDPLFFHCFPEEQLSLNTNLNQPLNQEDENMACAKKPAAKKPAVKKPAPKKK